LLNGFVGFFARTKIHVKARAARILSLSFAALDQDELGFQGVGFLLLLKDKFGF
jgi:hypothetical protein